MEATSPIDGKLDGNDAEAYRQALRAADDFLERCAMAAVLGSAVIHLHNPWRQVADASDRISDLVDNIAGWHNSAAFGQCCRFQASPPPTPCRKSATSRPSRVRADTSSRSSEP
jgi:hypothetical protein